jgi:hypothetical protein
VFLQRQRAGGGCEMLKVTAGLLTKQGQGKFPKILIFDWRRDSGPLLTPKPYPVFRATSDRTAASIVPGSFGSTVNRSSRLNRSAERRRRIAQSISQKPETSALDIWEPYPIEKPQTQNSGIWRGNASGSAQSLRPAGRPVRPHEPATRRGTDPCPRRRAASPFRGHPRRCRPRTACSAAPPRSPNRAGWRRSAERDGCPWDRDKRLHVCVDYLTNPV